jgi:hypothetical protein
MQHQLKENLGTVRPVTVNLRCPHCLHTGTFSGILNCSDVTWIESIGGTQPSRYKGGMRRCPNLDCESLVFVVMKGGVLDESFPPEIIDFDATNLPSRILDSLEEAIKAHSAGCYRACALMIRRVLEELCQDKGAAGDDLKQRLSSLGGAVIVPKELLDAADELRLLGNDAAHVEAKAYDSVGEAEATVAVQLAKELLKAVYQYTSLVAKLRGLKKPTQP